MGKVGYDRKAESSSSWQGDRQGYQRGQDQFFVCSQENNPFLLQLTESSDKHLSMWPVDLVYVRAPETGYSREASR